MKLVFGPVNSRRFGLSLGIDLSPLHKSCNFDCLYCELDAAKPIDHIDNPPSVEAVVEAVKEGLALNPQVDVITITSNGEPTLYKNLDRLVDALDEVKGEKKLLILSNASTITDPHVRSVLEKIDIVKLSLDCASESCFKKIDRPMSGIKVADIIEGMKRFANDFRHTLVVEILVVAGVNDHEVDMEALNKALKEIKPSRIDLGTIDRPPAYHVKSVSTQRLYELSHCFEGLPVTVIHKDAPKERIDFSEEELWEMIKRRPQSEFDVASLFSENAQKHLEKLLHEKKVIKSTIAGVVFYSDANRILSR